MEHIVITGEGILCAIGLDKSAVLASLQEKRSGVGTMRHLQSVHKELPVGEVDLSNDDMRQLLGVSDPLINRTTLIGMLAVRQALADAGIDRQSVQQEHLRVVLITGTTVAGMDVTEKLFHQLEDSDEFLKCLSYHSAGSSSRLIAEYFDLFSTYTTISTACSSAANALMVGARMLADGDADMVVAGGTEALSLFHLNGFHSLMILDAAVCRPFDASRAGLNLGEGGAYVVMETETSALRRKQKPHAYLTGYGNACDAFHQTASSENGEGAFLAMTEALAMANLSPADIQYVSAHGTGTPNNDLSESTALKRVFGEQMPLVSSTKAFTGHTTSASGSIESVISILALNHQFVPANLHWATPADGCITPTLGEENYPLENVMCNAFGFGGNDTVLIFSRSPQGDIPHTRPTPKDIKIMAQVEITSEDQLGEIRQYVKPMEARRMGRILKSSLLSSLKVLEQAGIQQPDAIVTGTALGCLENSEGLLQQLLDEGEVMLKPTYFMQSTHNTISSNLAIHLGCHGYNITYTQDEASLDWAMRDARRLIESGQCKTVLVGFHDETTVLYRKLMERLGHKNLKSIHSIAILLSCGE